MDLFSSLNVSASGLEAQRTRLDTAASNLANAYSTRSADGGPYQRRNVVLSAVDGQGADGSVEGVEVVAIEKDPGAPRLEYDPGHPDADERGFVAYPNVNPVEEMVDMVTATRAYQAGLTAISSEVSMLESALEIGR
ncbi:MAG: flagellar basal body rod protein FlgC [Deltaproteobacteria bacterium]|nr:flagellar basal body rod protein FlgC [Deltaproteobacteria bacterium]